MLRGVKVTKQNNYFYAKLMFQVTPSKISHLSKSRIPYDSSDHLTKLCYHGNLIYQGELNKRIRKIVTTVAIPKDMIKSGIEHTQQQI